MIAGEGPTPIPDEWSDPRHVMPHLSEQLGDWLRAMRSIQHELAAVMDGLGADGRPVDPDHTRARITAIHARLVELNHEVGTRLQAYSLIAHELTRAGDRT